MSLATITEAAEDPALQARITAAVWKEAIANPTFGDTVFGQQVQRGSAAILMVFAYPVAVDTEAVYEAGGDAAVTDAMIGSAIQVHWPEDPA